MDWPNWLRPRNVIAAGVVAGLVALGGWQVGLFDGEDGPVIDPANMGAPVVIPEGQESPLPANPGATAEPSEQLPPELVFPPGNPEPTPLPAPPPPPPPPPPGLTEVPAAP